MFGVWRFKMLIDVVWLLVGYVCKIEVFRCVVSGDGYGSGGNCWCGW